MPLCGRLSMPIACSYAPRRGKVLDSLVERLRALLLIRDQHNSHPLPAPAVRFVFLPILVLSGF